MLCIGGPIKYKLRMGTGLTEDWFYRHISRYISQLYPRAVALLFGKALLWGIFDEKISAVMDTRYVACVKAAYSQVKGNLLEESVNPI